MVRGQPDRQYESASLAGALADKPGQQLVAEHATLLSQIADGLLIADSEERVTYMNKAGLRLVGRDLTGETVTAAAALLGTLTADGEACRSEELVLLRALRFGETTTNVERRIHHIDGTEVIIQGSAAPVMAADGTRFGAVFTFRDITEQRRTEEALREREKRLQTIFRAAPIQIAIADLQGRFLDTNPAMQAMLGYSADELRGLPHTAVTHPDDASAYAQLDQELREGKRDRFRVEKRYLRKDGQVVWGDLSASLVRDSAGKPQFVIGMVMYITDRKHIEEELQARERQQAAVAELGQYALASDDLLAVFAEALALIAQTLRAEYGAVLELLPEGDRLMLRAGTGWKYGLVGHAMVGARPDSQAGYTLLAQGPVIVQDLHTETRFHGSPLLTEHGIVSGVSVIIRGRGHPFGVLSVHSRNHRCFVQDDVYFLQAIAHVLGTAVERKRIEEERERYSRELAMRVLLAQEEERTRIARELHDETVQGLSTLLVNLDLLNPHVSLPPLARAPGLERVRGIAQHTLDGVRVLARTLRPSVLDDLGLAAALNALGTEYMHLYGIPVQVTDGLMDGERLPSEVETALYRIAQEALANACKHAHAEWIQVRLARSDDAVELIITDNGTGFDFNQAHPGQLDGLGLQGMRERAALLGGTLNIETAARRGTQVTLVAPVRLERRITVNSQRVLGEDKAMEADLRVLLVDDHALFREGLRLVLQARSNIAVVGEAEDGRQAIELVERLRPHVVVLDIAMPRLNGVDATLQIKRRVPNVKVVILTVHESREYLAQVARVGAEAYVLKRSAATELVDAVQAVARGQTYVSPTIAGAMLDAFRLRSDRRGADLLTAREREVLQLVAEGYINQAIASQLGISVKTVQKHRDNILRKLDAHDRTDLVKHAIRMGMIAPE